MGIINHIINKICPNNTEKDEENKKIDYNEIESYKFENDERKYYYKSGPNEIVRLNKELGENIKIIFIDDLNLSKNIPVGLENLYGCCYMNACLQCFYHCELFSISILKNKEALQYKNSPIANALVDLLEGLYQNGKPENINGRKSNPHSAKKFYDVIIKKYPSFKESFGNDPKLVAELILIFMQQELVPNFSFRPERSINKCNEEELFENIYSEYKKNTTPVWENFYFIEKKKSICSECLINNPDKCNTYTFKDYHMHYFYIGSICKKFDINNCTLYDCFNYYNEPDTEENLEFKCFSCKKRVKGKQILYYMATLPNYLLICLGKENENREEYKLLMKMEIDLKKYFEPCKAYIGSMETKYKFHAGVFIRGNETHAIAICRNFNGKLYEFNDTICFPVSEDIKKLNEEKPYLLFYRRSDLNI
jgi:ubiquitin C-terminal hydrolase